MKYFITLLLLVSFISCTQDEDNEESKNLGQSEADIIAYINNNDLDASRTSNGVYYVIDEQGEGDFPTDDAYIEVFYTGYYLDGVLFDSWLEEPITLDLLNVIPGFVEGVANFNIGSKGTIFIPPSLAYGDSGNGTIPGGAVLIFDIEMVEITNPQTEDDIIDYLSENELVAEVSDSGLYYIMEEEGTGEDITSSSTVTVAYKGYFLNGNEFDASDSNGAQFNLQNVVSGFAEGISYFKAGGKGTLFLPPNLAYGSEGTTNIPRNSVLIFDIEVKSLDN